MHCFHQGISVLIRYCNNNV